MTEITYRFSDPTILFGLLDKNLGNVDLNEVARQPNTTVAVTRRPAEGASVFSVTVHVALPSAVADGILERAAELP